MSVFSEAETVGTSCPFCLQMMNEGVGSKGVSDTKKAKDILELLVESLGDDVPSS